MVGLTSLVIGLVPLLVWYAYHTVHRLRIKQYADYPQLTPSLLWGHLASIGEFYKKGDARRHIDYVFRQMGESIGLPPLFIIDMRPFFYVICIVLSHEVAEQISRSSKAFPYSTPKSPTMGAIQPIIGVHSIVSSQGEYWKSLRRRYNAGFAPTHLLTLLPRILEKTVFFLDKLDSLAQSGEEFAMEPLTTNLTFDIIGAVVMDEDLHAQLPESSQSELVKTYRKLLFTYTNDNSEGFLPFNPIQYFRRRKLSRMVDQTLKSMIREKFASASAPISTSSSDTTFTPKARSVLSLSLRDTEDLNELVLQQTADQLKSFLFAGHDTTSIVLQWAFYELSRSPQALASLRNEHDSLFGADPSPEIVADILREHGDEVMAKMSYTSAVIKEILRLYPPAGTARRVQPNGGFFVTLPDEAGGSEGKRLCLDGMVLYNMHTAIQRDSSVYGDNADVFFPDRWLGDVDTSAAASADETLDAETKNGGAADGTKTIPPSAWRPFERGPRNCIGQELANIEARVILALAVRRYDFEKVGAGKLKVDQDGKNLVDEVTGQFDVETPLFNTRQVTAKPFDGTMMKVHRRA